MIKDIKKNWVSNNGDVILCTVSLDIGIDLPGITFKKTLGGGYDVKEPSSRGKDGRWYKNYYISDDFKNQIADFLNKN